MGKRGHGIPMVTLDIEALAAVGYRAGKDGFPGAEIVVWVGFFRLHMGIFSFQG